MGLKHSFWKQIPFLRGLNKIGDVQALFSAQVGLELPADFVEEIAERKRNHNQSLLYVFGRGDTIGSSAIVGDPRWSGAFGVDADYVARGHCSVEFIDITDIEKILNKVEFFPIKCRIQNAKENFRKYQEDLKNAVKWDSDQFLAGNKTKTIFFWTLIARNISRVLDKSGKLESVKGTNQTREQSESGGSPLEIDGNESQLSNEQDRQIEAAFSLFDTDENGFLADDEMKSALFALGYLTSSEGNISIRDLSQSYHIDSKKVDLDQFKKIMRGKIVRRSDLEEIQMTFCAIVNPTWLDQKLSTGTVVDVKELPSPKIDFEKLRQACNRYEVKLSDEELKNILKETDTNKDEDVDWDEYVSILKNSCWF